ncbi:hypothetical protein HU200_046058 [Digitaria exilis]|uniref:Uncharacterized protein n=1 Tax=Digitaria exilis TaxID=1010633 RepID=A0A835EFC4_9POAL|nr:hypothetical protein HU200_046058 [Digitaria exilis]
MHQRISSTSKRSSRQQGMLVLTLAFYRLRTFQLVYHRGTDPQINSHAYPPARPAVVYDSGERAWARWRGSPGPTPVAAAGGLVLYRDVSTAELTVVNPLTGASRALPSPPPAATAAGALQAVAMFGSPAYRVVLILGELPDLSMATFDSTTNAWEDDVVPLSRKTEGDAGATTTRERVAEEGEGEGDDTVYFLSKSGDVVATTMQQSASRQYTSAVVTAGGEDAAAAVAYFLSRSGTVVACDMARRAFAELPRILPAYHEYSIDVVACGGAAYVVVLSEFLDTASLRVWELDAGGAWRQVAAMPPAMSHAFSGAKADVNCVGHGDRVMVCVSSGDVAGARGCFVCDVRNNRWEELTCCGHGDGEEAAATGFVAALSFEPRMEAAV